MLLAIVAVPGCDQSELRSSSQPRMRKFSFDLDLSAICIVCHVRPPYL
jgi:hypothetical protein